jgi:hypothetical protein
MAFTDVRNGVNGIANPAAIEEAAGANDASLAVPFPAVTWPLAEFHWRGLAGTGSSKGGQEGCGGNGRESDGRTPECHGWLHETICAPPRYHGDLVDGSGNLLDPDALP